MENTSWRSACILLGEIGKVEERNVAVAAQGNNALAQRALFM